MGKCSGSWDIQTLSDQISFHWSQLYERGLSGFKEESWGYWDLSEKKYFKKLVNSILVH